LATLGILFFTRFFAENAPGLSAQLFEEITRLSKNIRIVVLTNKITSEKKNENLVLVKVPQISIPILKTLVSTIGNFCASFQHRNDYEIVFTRIISLDWIIPAILLKLLLKKKYVLWLGASRKTDSGFRGKFFVSFLKKAISIADVIGCSSSNTISDVEDYLGKIDRKKIHIFNQAVDINLFKPIDSFHEENTILCVARIHPEKGLEDLIHATPIIIKKFPNIKIKIIGLVDDKNYFKKIKKLIQELDCIQNIELVGPIAHNDLVKWYNLCKIFVLTSKTEEQSIVTLEAMACGKPVVVTKVGALPEFIEDGSNGFLMDLKQPEELAEKITLLMNDEQLRKKIGTKARNTIENKFSFEKYIIKLTNIFESVSKGTQKSL